MLNKQQTTKPHAMKNPNNSCKRTGGLAALVLVGLLAGQAARAEVMTFETSLAPITAGSAGTVTMPAAYQPLAYVKIGYSSGYNSLYYCFSTLTAYQWDHTTTSYGGTHYFVLGVGSGIAVPFTFNQPCASRRSSWPPGVGNPPMLRSMPTPMPPARSCSRISSSPRTECSVRHNAQTWLPWAPTL
jgi:hypothetical protein